MKLVQISYFSEAAAALTPDDLAAIIRVSQTRNPEIDVTGVLLLRKGRFFQVLEGPERALELLLNRIRQDRRHHDLLVVSRRAIRQREYPNWAMGWTDMPPSTPELAEMFDRISHETRASQAANPSEVHFLVESFSRGLWDMR